MSRSTQQVRSPITDPGAVLTFGKYKGHSIEELLKDDPQYLVWLHTNSAFFELGHELLNEAEEGRSAIGEMSWQDWISDQKSLA